MGDSLHPILDPALDPVPEPGPWAVAVSGGADSVALLLILRNYPELKLHVVHLDHQTRQGASALDAQFVADLCKKFSLPCAIGLREQYEPDLVNLPSNMSARFRAVRMAFFRQVVKTENLQGVILAHHADDQAETILLRLLRGSGPAGLSGMEPVRHMRGLTLVRPLLHVPRQELRDYLVIAEQPWREDLSNLSSEYRRNQIRKWLWGHPETTAALIALGQSCARYNDWVRQSAPDLPDEFYVRRLATLPRPLARESARRWLQAGGAVAEQLAPDVLDRLRLMAADAATPRRQKFPGSILVCRTAGQIRCQTPPEAEQVNDEA
jgi:tRNA(Ile)-lysidine synthetase-like protein